MRWDAQAIQDAVGDWKTMLERLGIDGGSLTGKHVPCPACGGHDRFRFDDRHGRGDFYCNGCGAGDGFALLMRVHDWSFADARRAVIQAAGLDSVDTKPRPSQRQTSRVEPEAPARPTARVRDIRRTSTTPDAVSDVIEYLRSRGLWPLPPGCTLVAHAAAEYWQDGQCIGKFAALVAEVRDIDGELVTAHITYLQDGRKLSPHAPRKLLGKLTGRRGCAIRLMPVVGDELGIAEGVETALAAHLLHDLPVWAATSATILAKFVPPLSVRKVIVFADNDVDGIEAAIALRENLDGRTAVETRTPPAPANDWADVLASVESEPSRRLQRDDRSTRM